MRRSVVFPEPEGPRKTKNSPSSVTRLTSLTAPSSPSLKTLVRFRVSTIAIKPSLSLAREIAFAHRRSASRGRALAARRFPRCTLAPARAPHPLGDRRVTPRTDGPEPLDAAFSGASGSDRIGGRRGKRTSLLVVALWESRSDFHNGCLSPSVNSAPENSSRREDAPLGKPLAPRIRSRSSTRRVEPYFTSIGRRCACTRPPPPSRRLPASGPRGRPWRTSSE